MGRKKPTQLPHVNCTHGSRGSQLGLLNENQKGTTRDNVARYVSTLNENIGSFNTLNKAEEIYDAAKQHPEKYAELLEKVIECVCLSS